MISKLKENPIRCLLYYVAFYFLFLSLILDNPINTINGLKRILTTPDSLITDYMGVGGASAAFLNSAIVTFLSLFMIDFVKVKYNGTTISSIFLMTAFSLFGKNFFNILPIILGVYIYAKFQKNAFRKYIYIALLGTSISPVVSEIALTFDGGLTPLSITCGIIVGAFAGFLLPALSLDALRILQGFNLYNTGFAAGLIGVLFASCLTSFGYDSPNRMVWTYGIDPFLAITLYVLFLSFILIGFLLNGKSFNGYSKVFRHSGRAVADFTVMDGVPIAFINMGIVGVFAISYIYIIGGDLNGPTIGAILTIVGFGALGKHLKNMIPPMIGVLTVSLVSSWTLTDPAIQLAALFCTGLAPISGTFGIGWGIVAGALHSVIVLCVTSLHGGLNLYNNGFAAGLVVMLLHPTIEALTRDKESD